MNLQEMVRQARERAGGVVNLAEKLGVSQQTLWVAEHYPSELSAADGKDLRRKLDVLRRPVEV